MNYKILWGFCLISLLLVEYAYLMRGGQVSRVATAQPAVTTQSQQAVSHVSGRLGSLIGEKSVSLKEFIEMKNQQVSRIMHKPFPGDPNYVEETDPLNTTGAIAQGAAIIVRSLKELPGAVIALKKTQKGMAAYQQDLAGAEQSVKSALEQVAQGEQTIGETATQVQEEARGLLDKAQEELLEARKRFNKEALEQSFSWKNGKTQSIRAFLKTEGAKLVQRYPHLDRIKGSMTPFLGLLGIDVEELFEMWRSGNVSTLQKVATTAGEALEAGQMVKSTVEGAETAAGVVKTATDAAVKPLAIVNKVVN